ncbi:hypothetical protein [Microbacterium enclense]|uniref:hypothetical protein n=1 Tax=Microbacterium enclense TaxID=993073 RepID=UPI003F8068E1
MSEALTLPEFYYCSEVATKLRRTEAAIRWAWSTGALKSRVVGGRRVSTAEDITAYFEANA